MSQAVSRRSVTAAGLVRSQMSPCEICDGRSGRGPGFAHSTLVSPCQIIPPTLHTHLHMHAALARRTKGWSLGTFQKPMTFWKWGALDTKVLSVFVFK